MPDEPFAGLLIPRLCATHQHPVAPCRSSVQSSPLNHSLLRGCGRCLAGKGRGQGNGKVGNAASSAADNATYARIKQEPQVHPQHVACGYWPMGLTGLESDLPWLLAIVKHGAPTSFVKMCHLLHVACYHAAWYQIGRRALNARPHAQMRDIDFVTTFSLSPGTLFEEGQVQENSLVWLHDFDRMNVRTVGVVENYKQAQDGRTKMLTMVQFLTHKGLLKSGHNAWNKTVFVRDGNGVVTDLKNYNVTGRGCMWVSGKQLKGHDLVTAPILAGVGL